MDCIESRVMKLEFCVETLTELVKEMRKEQKYNSNRMKDWVLGIIAGVLIVFLVSLGSYTLHGVKSDLMGGTEPTTSIQRVK